MERRLAEMTPTEDRNAVSVSKELGTTTHPAFKRSPSMHEQCSSLALRREGLRVATVTGLVLGVPEACQEFISMLRAVQLNLG